ncbi:MAG: hypothetical protein ABSF50_14210 [Burkholderiaceae bacterium]|jgi:hypothetical protein
MNANEDVQEATTAFLWLTDPQKLLASAERARSSVRKGIRHMAMMEKTVSIEEGEALVEEADTESEDES